ncbi:MAG: DUF2889 domain-containing protein [Proteobacteria bacterium]|nr:DUF2889 domain-containing protein [Desulfobacula sp.]MBU3954016.1 DUF2889 domain-containing protein [Pseudomonadota bacterium]MBU4132190.1 DUF2889 domain-containing protein [Pseudomonadota bacterium]
MLRDLMKEHAKIHTRNISLSTCPHTEDRVLVHGELKDQRYIPVFDVTGKTRAPGIVHHMTVTLLIDPNPLTIVQAEARMLTVPMEECQTTLDRVAMLVGVEIKPGFSSHIRKIMGGNRGCTHLCGLVVAMGQEIVHGWLTQKRSKKSPIPVSLDKVKEKGFLIDSCRIWKKDGPKMREMRLAIEKKADTPAESQ